MRLKTLAALSSLAVSASAGGQFLYVVDSTNDRVRLHSAQDGSVINDNFIDIAAATGGAARTVIQAIDVGNEI